VGGRRRGGRRRGSGDGSRAHPESARREGTGAPEPQGDRRAMPGERSDAAEPSAQGVPLAEGGGAPAGAPEDHNDSPSEGSRETDGDQVRSERQVVRQPLQLAVFLARAGVGSRRRTDELVQQGRVTVNGVVETFPRRTIGPDDEVMVDGEPVEPRELRYVLVNKPRGVASTRSDPHAERLLVDLVPNGRTLFPVGRLDVETTGLIILTNDGVLANRLMHPRYGVAKTYTARVQGHVSKAALQALRTGIDLEDGRTAPAEARLVKQGPRSAVVELTLHEGRKRQVRRMLAALGLPVEELQRRRYGPLSDKGLSVGAWRELTAEEVEALRRAGEETERRVRSREAQDDLGLGTAVEP